MVHTHRYAKQVLSHLVQVDVTFLKLIGNDGKATRRHQCTAIDDPTRIRALKVYKRHNQRLGWNTSKLSNEVVRIQPDEISNDHDSQQGVLLGRKNAL